MLYSVDDERNDGELVLTSPYFSGHGPLRFDEGTTYADDSVQLNSATTYEWPHSLAEIIQPLLSVGLDLLSFQEHTVIPWKALPSMVATRRGFELPEGAERLPLTFSIAARRPL